MSNTKYTFKHASLSDVGLVRQLNEDRELVVPINPDCMAYIVCDGMGGHDSGDKASEAAVRFISEYLTTKPFDNASIALANAIKFANQQIYFESKVSPTSKGMGTTAVVMLQYQDEIHVGHVGDSRAYRFNNNKLTQITKDHSVVQDMVDQGLISQSQSEHHPRKNEITKALGIRETEEPSISKNIKAVKGDRFILCSDGLSGLISHETFTKTVQTHWDPNVCAMKLIQLAKQGGGHDNITVQVIDVLESPNKAVKEQKSNQNLILSIAAGVVGIMVVTFTFRNSIIEIISPKATEETKLSSSTQEGETALPNDGRITKTELLGLLKYALKQNQNDYKEYINKNNIDKLKSNNLIIQFNMEDSTYVLTEDFAEKVRLKQIEESNVVTVNEREGLNNEGKAGNGKNGGNGKTGNDKTGNNKTGNNKSGNNKTGIDKTGNNKTSNDKTGNDKASNDKTGNDKASNDKTSNDKTGNDKTVNDKTSNDKTGNDKTTNDKTSNEKTSNEKATNDKTSNDKTRNDKTVNDKTNNYKTGNGKSGNGKVGNGKIGRP